MIETTNNGIICPKCEKEISGFTKHGKQNFVTCPEGCRIGLSNLTDDEYDQHVKEIKIEKKEPNNALPEIPSDAEILEDVLSTFEINKQKQNIILKRLRKNGIMEPLELQNLLVGLRAIPKETVSFVVSDYQLALERREIDRRNLEQAIAGRMRPPPQQEQEQPKNEPDEFDKMLKMMRVMKEMDQRNPQPNPTESSEIKELKAQIERLEKENQKKELDLVKESMNQQVQFLQREIEGAKGYKEDTFRLAASGFDRWMDAIESGAVQVGDFRKANLVKGKKFRSEDGKKADSSNDEIAEMIDPRYIDDLVNDEHENLKEIEDGDDNE